MSVPRRRALLPTRPQYFDEWARLHGGYDPRGSRLVGGWLTLTYVLARPLALARFSPNVLTLIGGLVASTPIGLAALGSRWVLLASATVVVAGVLDNLDGAVAVLTGKSSRWGYVLDSLVDRLADALFVAVFWFLGAPGWVCVVGGALMGLHEYARARAVSGGLPDIGIVTVWERPTRVIVTAMFLLGAGLHVEQARSWATAGAAAWVGLGAVGLIQLLVVVRARLVEAPT